MAPQDANRTLDQRRAAQAYADVRGVVNTGDGKKAVQLRRKYASYVKDLPVMFLKCGIGQTLAFLDSKRKGASDGPEALLITHVSDWVGALPRVNVARPQSAHVNWLLEALLGSSADAWRAAADEGVAYGTWLKRFGEALIPEAAASEAEDFAEDADENDSEKDDGQA